MSSKRSSLLIKWSVVLVILLGFIFLRWWRLDQTLFFRNDIGRDLLTLYNWQETGKPPLLGPQTGALAFNQSPIYFYFFYPIFVISSHSPYTTNLTLSLIYILSFISGVVLLKNNKKQLVPLLTVGFLLTIHPLVVEQHRAVWNPSFVPLFLIAGWFFFQKIQTSFSPKNAFFFALSLALAVGMSVSAIPAVISFLCLSLFVFRKDIKKILIIFNLTVLAHILVFLPLLAFEIKYKFQLITRMFSLGVTGGANAGASTMTNLTNLSSWLLPTINHSLLGILIFIILGCLLLKKNKPNHWHKLINHQIFQALFLFILTTVMVVSVPIQLESHYIFGALSFLLLTIAVFPQKINWLIVSVLIIAWLRPSFISKNYLQPAPRTISTLNTCFQDFCTQFQQPLFVSVQASHNYHYGPEFKYLMKHYGCQVEDIEKNPPTIKTMAVIADGSHYDHAQTKFDELTIFGNSSETQIITCAENLKIHLLMRE